MMNCFQVGLFPVSLVTALLAGALNRSCLLSPFDLILFKELESKQGLLVFVLICIYLVLSGSKQGLAHAREVLSHRATHSGCFIKEKALGIFQTFSVVCSERVFKDAIFLGEDTQTKI